jgi:ankyrin repeat protein
MSVSFVRVTVSLIIIGCSLLFSTVSFADKERELIEAIQQNKIEDVKTILKTGIDFDKVDYFLELPSLEASELLLANGLDLNNFFNLVISHSKHPYDVQHNEELLLKQKALVGLALKKGLDPNFLLKVATNRSWSNKDQTTVIDLYKHEEYIEIALKAGAKFSTFKIDFTRHYGLSPKAVKVMLENSVDPDKVLLLILPNYGCDNTAAPEGMNDEQRDSLINLALEKGASASRLLDLATNKRIYNNYPLHLCGKDEILHLCGKDEMPIKIALDHGAKFSAIKIVEGNSYLPSLEAVQLMLANLLLPNDLLSLVINSHTKDYNHESRKFEPQDKLATQQNRLVNLAIEKGADLKSIKYFVELPSLQLGELLLQKGLDPNLFLSLILQIGYEGEYDNGSFSISKEWYQNRDALVNLALAKGAKHKIINDINMIKILKLENKLLSSQMADLVEPVDEDGKTLLLLAAEFGFTNLVQMQLHEGADPTKKDNNGKTALDLAKESSNASSYLMEILENSASVAQRGK